MSPSLLRRRDPPEVARPPRRLGRWAAVAALTIGTGLLAASGSPWVRNVLRSTVLFRLNVPLVRRVDAELFNLTHDLRAPAELGDGGPVGRLILYDPVGLDRDRAGNLYLADRGFGGAGRIVWRIDPAGVAHALGGTGRRGVAADGNALGSSLGTPQGLCVDSSGTVYLADSYNHVVLRIDSAGRVSRFAGTGRPDDVGDGGPAVRAALNQPYDVRIGAEGDVYIADFGNHRIRRVDRAGVIHTVAGTGNPGFGGDGGPAVVAQLHGPYGVYFDRRWGLLIGDSFNHRVRRVDSAGVITTIAGNGIQGFSGNGGPATAASFDAPQGLGVDAAGRLLIGDEHNHAIRIVGTDGTVHSIAGIGAPGWAADASDGRVAPLNDPENVIGLEDGTILFTEAGNRRLRALAPDGRLRTIAGGGE